jgi:tetratricopeptide (TPR) repeat protein
VNNTWKLTRKYLIDKNFRTLGTQANGTKRTSNLRFGEIPMNSLFTDILQKLVTEQGKEALLNSAKCKAFLADYTKGEYKKESRLLLQALEVGVQKAIDTTEELEICKKQQTRILQEEHFVAAEAAVDIVDTLALVLRDEKKSKIPKGVVCSNCGKELQKEWTICPYCETRVEKTNNLNKKATPQKNVIALSNSGSTIDNTQQEKPITTVICDQSKKYLSRGEVYFLKKKYRMAIDNFNEAIILAPNNAVAYALRGNAYYQLGIKGMAIQDAKKAISLDATLYSAEQLLQQINGY